MKNGAPEKAKTIRTASWQVLLATLVLALGLGTTAWVARSQGWQDNLRV